VTLDLRMAAGEAVVAVSDTGPGISPADQKRLFDRFFRTASATAGVTPGTGLGLTIAKAIVEAHHGTIEVESVVGSGSTFRATLPVDAA
jgi:signal transduction histidine kinase